MSGRAGRIYVRWFLRLGLDAPLLPPKTTMELRVRRVHGSSDTPCVSPAPTSPTPRQHAHAAQGDRYDVTARRRDGAIARTYGWDAAEPPVTSERRGWRYFGFE